ncbi:hypothetical protein [Streptomyces sp. NBC_01803]|uniref:hypothetical protein n=1 Tax=Streptomyces sp. NBC_01803 TaxID=2975946 RepID=UPI002DD9895C|nr:hypothetical protein [Streptomyces sp. NBC_01803]WSA43002.1 phosphotransferase [Streptomyces sp. NBC_01803]
MQTPSSHDLSRWCEQHLGSPAAEQLFAHVHLSAAVGLRLADGRRVVVKARPAAQRLRGCFQVQQHLYSAGFPCPRPLVRPTGLNDLEATAEELVPGGTLLADHPDAPELFAAALARLVAAAPAVTAVDTLAPAPPWIGWDHDDSRPWPWPDDMDIDLNDLPEPAWLARTARRVRARLADSDLPDVVGHGDFESQNTRWSGRELHAVHDWDSAVARPEAALAGQAAAVFGTTGAPGETTPLPASERFLDAYERARGQAWTREEREVAWAAGLWVLVFNAKKESAKEANGPECTHLATEVDERLRRARA